MKKTTFVIIGLLASFGLGYYRNTFVSNKNDNKRERLSK